VGRRRDFVATEVTVIAIATRSAPVESSGYLAVAPKKHRRKFQSRTSPYTLSRTSTRARLDVVRLPSADQTLGQASGCTCPPLPRRDPIRKKSSSDLLDHVTFIITAAPCPRALGSLKPTSARRGTSSQER